MKKSLLLIILVISGFIGFAQLEVKEGSFKKVDGFVNINIEKMYDDNDKPYAVLKIKTENINDKQRRELGFGGDAQTFFETEYKDGEVWLYISYYATFLKISHPDLSSTEFWFPYDMEPKRGYELTLVNKPAIDEEIISRIEKLENSKSEVVANSDDFGYIVVKTGSLEGATVYIDGNEMEMKTPFVSDPIKQGPHKVKVVKAGHETYQDIVIIEANKTQTINVDMNKMKTINDKRYFGLVLTPEINVSYFPDNIGKASIAILPQLNLEYMITSSFGLGIGTGLFYANTGMFSIPLYGQFSYYMNNKKVSPYVNVKIGALMTVEEYIENKVGTDNYNSAKGFMGSATIGVNIKHSRIGISLGTYHSVIESISSWTGETYWTNISDKFAFGVTYSYMIPFGNKK